MMKENAYSALRLREHKKRWVERHQGQMSIGCYGESRTVWIRMIYVVIVVTVTWTRRFLQPLDAARLGDSLLRIPGV